MVFEVRDLWPELPIAAGALRNPVVKWLAKLLEKLAYRNSAHIVALSPGMRDGIVHTGYKPKQVTVIPNCCDIELFRVPEDDGKKFLARHPYLQGSALITYAGTLGQINGVDYLVDIADSMIRVDPTVRFLIAGDGGQREYIFQRALAKKVLEKNLWIIPPVSKRDMPGLLSASTFITSLFVNIPEMWNNSANKFFDALAAGRAVLINYRGWQAELLEETGAGIVVPPEDPEKAARMLCDFLKNKSRLRKAAAIAAELGETRFDRNMLADKLLNVIKQVSIETA
jgi:glycosyltransferase involved in cell wall biosynthesis